MTAHAFRSYGPSLAALLAIVYLAVMWAAGARPERTHLIRYEAKGVMTVDPGSIVRVTIRAGGKTRTFVRQSNRWADAKTSTPLAEEKARAIALAIKFMHTANPVRIFKPSEVPKDADKKFGLTEPSLGVSLANKKGLVVEAAFGNLTNDGFLHYMRVKGRDEIFLMSRFVLKEWQKI